MFKTGPKYLKLKTSLQIAITRLKYLQSKKLELSEKVKLEILKCIQNGKYMQARIKAQRFLRYEATIEAMELIEMYCEQLLERYDLFQYTKELDESLIIPISSLIWVTPYYGIQVAELRVVMKQLAAKYGNRFCRMALSSREGVSPELIERVKLFVSTDEKVEKCLRKICRKCNIDYKENKRCSMCKKCDKERDFYSTDEAKEEEKIPQESSEYQASGSNSIDESISSKKAFMTIMSRLRIKKKSKKSKSIKSKEDSSNKVISSPTLEASILSKAKVKETDNRLNDSVVDNEDISSSTTPEAEKTEQNYYKISKKEFSHDPNIASFVMPSSPPASNFGRMYPEPPPPYNYPYSAGIYNDFDRGTYHFINTFQFPSCPELSDFPP